MIHYFLTIDERTHVIRSSKMAFGRKPVWISGPDIEGTLVLHVTGSLEYQDGGGSRYAPSRFLVLHVEAESRTVDGLLDLECSLVVEIAGIPKKPSKRRSL